MENAPQPDPNTPDIATVQAQLAGVNDQLAAATADYIEVAKHANPDLPEAAFTGDSIAAVKLAVNTARSIADHVKAQAVVTPSTAEPVQPPAPAAAAPVVTPPPAPAARTPEAPSNLRGLDRIRAGIAKLP